LQRQRVKRLLMELEREHAGLKQSMLNAMMNVVAGHLLDRRLNPPDEAAATLPDVDGVGADAILPLLTRAAFQARGSSPSTLG
jgi:hypothetical protein